MVCGCLWLNKYVHLHFPKKLLYYTSSWVKWKLQDCKTKILNTTKSQIYTVKGVAIAESLSEAGIGAGEPWRALSGYKS